METLIHGLAAGVPLVLLLGALLIVALKSWHQIGPTEFGLITKRLGTKLSGDIPIAFKGEAGYQAELLQPGLRFKLWPIYAVEKFPWVQVPPGGIGIVVSQVGASLPAGAKSAVYKAEFGNFTDLRTFIEKGGQKGVQRPVLPQGTTLQLHPVAFMVITADGVFGRPVSDDLVQKTNKHGQLSCDAFGLEPKQLTMVKIEPGKEAETGKVIDRIGIVTTLDGDPLPSGDIACRLGGFADIAALEASGAVTDATLLETVLGNQSVKHNNFQNFQAFLDAGGKIGLQHDPLLYGEYALNPLLVRVTYADMLVIRQGEVAVVKSYVGLPAEDTSGQGFKFGSIVRPGHMGIWQEPLRTGKYALNPRCYSPEIVPTSILTLNWADAVSKAHNLDQALSQIIAKSNEGFVFMIDLQVQIHVPDTMAPKVISMVGTMTNLVNEVLQAAVGNHFRDKLQSMPAIKFINDRQNVQKEAMAHVAKELQAYNVETRGVYIQDVVLPAELVKVLTEREIASQEIQTYTQQQKAEDARIAMEKTRGMANQQAALAGSEVGITIVENKAKARKAEADGESYYLETVGAAKGADVRAIGLAKAEGYRAQVDALGQNATAIVNALEHVADSKMRLVPDVMVVGGGGGVEGLAATLMKTLVSGAQGVAANGNVAQAAAPVVEALTRPVPAKKVEPVTNGNTQGV
ncbi:MAG: hypothetical protein RLZZ324_1274 [Candidatus Parcubacteria bacterium]|jgi:hypothetical protein